MNVGIIGLGAISPLHIEAIINGGHSITAICDVNAEKRENAINKYRLCAKEYESYSEMLDRERLDAVHICTPHYLHAEMVCYALGKNVNTLCEKPLAISHEQLCDIERAVKGSKAQLGVVFQNHYNASVLYIKEFFRDKPIISAYANLAWCRDESYYRADTWKGTKDREGGGVMINQAIHSLDLLQWICGMPESVTAHTSNNSLKGIIEVEDTAFGLFELGGGRNFVINATNAARHSFPIIVSFHSEKDTVEMSGDNLIVNGKPMTRADSLPLYGKDEWGVGHQKLIADFYRCISSGERFPIGYGEGSRAVKLVLAMYRSQGEKINIEI